MEPLFKGLIIDEFDQPVGTAFVGGEPCYVINDNGFLRHVPSKPIDLEILKSFGNQIEGNEKLIADQATKMLGQEDLFTRAIVEAQLKNLDKQYELILNTGLPEETRVYLGMMGFRVTLDIHGEILKIEYPAAATDGEGDGEN
ncbi:MAG TPA: hypothetical protein PK883_09205 [Anaerolineaceae bacterium]|nr:hypothetical protein [Anaerolineaceae bacterium]